MVRVQRHRANRPDSQGAFDKYGHGNRELSYIAQIQNQPAYPAFHVVDGPYQEGSFVNNSQWTMVANSHYSGHVANITKLLFEYETSTANQWAQMHRGAYATASIPNSFYAQRNELPSYYVRGTAPYSFCFNYMVPNMSSQTPGGMGPILKQLAVRQAMQMGIDHPPGSRTCSMAWRWWKAARCPYGPRRSSTTRMCRPIRTTRQPG